MNRFSRKTPDTATDTATAIHNQTATKLFGETVTVEKRAIAKSINFGLLYGMTSRKLSNALSTGPEAYIKNYKLKQRRQNEQV